MGIVGLGVGTLPEQILPPSTTPLSSSILSWGTQEYLGKVEYIEYM